MLNKMKKGLFALMLLGFLALSLSSFRPPGDLEKSNKVEYSVTENQLLAGDNLVMEAEVILPLTLNWEPIGGFISEQPFDILPVVAIEKTRYRWDIKRYSTNFILQPTIKLTPDNSVTFKTSTLHRDPGRRGC
jgi:hypothetical protein